MARASGICMDRQKPLSGQPQVLSRTRNVFPLAGLSIIRRSISLTHISCQYPLEQSESSSSVAKDWLGDIWVARISPPSVLCQILSVLSLEKGSIVQATSPAG